MDIAKYDLLTNTDVTLFKFKSHGANGEIDKGIAYTMQDKNGNIFNVSFNPNSDFYGFIVKRK